MSDSVPTMWAAGPSINVSPECADRKDRMSQRISVVGEPTPENFTPYIYVEGESSVPSGITLFAATGGRWNIIQLPEEIVDLPLVEQMPALAALMGAYLERYAGDCPFLGRVRGFRLVRLDDSIRFGADGEFIEHIDGAFRRPHAELTIANRTLESLFK
jgi:hypothetical protein